MAVPKNIAFIPARKNSKGLKFKNRLLFNETAKFLENINIFSETILSTDDEYLIEEGKKRIQNSQTIT